MEEIKKERLELSKKLFYCHLNTSSCEIRVAHGASSKDDRSSVTIGKVAVHTSMHALLKATIHFSLCCLGVKTLRAATKVQDLCEQFVMLLQR
ncbi:hypothetical protein Y032_0013g2073 [Ancylostoma ceylanicum]|uniref:Uncharacterized protein n=1 Tax=Ancylostoma ceylanicum TaxID=53326 RepID=A0A016VAM6_9BILA|nr:hypothetical protein Y032_0013g2073 [Ancylostoma ceylanicum]